MRVWHAAYELDVDVETKMRAWNFKMTVTSRCERCESISDGMEPFEPVSWALAYFTPKSG